MYKRDLVLFGLDGVLVDLATLRARAWAEALTAAGAKVDEGALLARLEGVADHAFVHSIEAETGERLPEGFVADMTARLRAAIAAELQPVDEVQGALRRLRGRHAVVALSGVGVTRAALEKVGLWRTFISATFTAEQVERMPPAPDLYQFAASQLGVPASRCLVIESTVHGVRGGKAAGMTVFGFAGAASTLAEAQAKRLAAAGADLVFDRMRELAPLVGARAA